MYIPKERYEFVRDYAWIALIRAGVKELPVNLYEVCKVLDIHMKKYSENMDIVKYLKKEESRAFTFKGIDNNHYIFYDEKTRPYEQMRLDIAHEIGHIQLRHTSIKDYEQNKQYEEEARLFAPRLLAPAIALHACEILSYSDIMVFCELPKREAITRSNHMKKLEKKDRYLISDYEKIIYANMEKYFKHHNKYRRKQLPENSQ